MGTWQGAVDMNSCACCSVTAPGGVSLWGGSKNNLKPSSNIYQRPHTDTLTGRTDQRLPHLRSCNVMKEEEKVISVD